MHEKREGSMKEFLHEETPGKILSLLGAAMFSLAFLFTVSVSEASFSGSYVSLPDPFGPESVVATIDHAAAGYSDFLYAAVLNPTEQDLNEAVDAVAWIWEESRDEVVVALGLDGVRGVYQDTTGAVAGAYTSIADQPQGGNLNMNSIYDMIVE
jgi:hypothetical protein